MTVEEKVTEYRDLVSDDRLLMPALHPSLRLAMDGMVFEVESKLVGSFSDDVPAGGTPAIDLVKRYGLRPLRNLNSVEMLEAYMKQYINRLIPLLEKEGKDGKSIRLKMEQVVMKYLRERFSDLKFYTGNGSFRFLTSGRPFPVGSLVVEQKATATSHPPTFLYLAPGLSGVFNVDLERYLSICSITGLPPKKEPEPIEETEEPIRCSITSLPLKKEEPEPIEEKEEPVRCSITSLPLKKEEPEPMVEKEEPEQMGEKEVEKWPSARLNDHWMHIYRRRYLWVGDDVDPSEGRMSYWGANTVTA